MFRPIHINSSQLLCACQGTFNVVLDSGIVPTEWCIGVIIPIFKNKGENTNPDNYREITLLSCLGKLFTSVLNNRIS